MSVRDILKTKGFDVITARPDQSVAEAAQMLHEQHIGALVVENGDKVVGILSERDIVRGIVRHGAALPDMTVGQLMTTDILTCRPDDNVEHLMVMMTDNRVRHLPVCDGKRLCGIVTIGDVVKERLSHSRMEVESLREYVATSR